ncbi:L-rhamnose mutarotase [Hymenobacter sp. 15J16-1T3B]|uniref:L-rhamnose mutarotase n=1 Tax=Hymenobacter sp. 15J16-1T3B TaxID=2886941 RepID=UPI001D10643C|nr:L-rhamnose mutarotase [Hymenobacter sp. 15J16-1T3B]MCC3160551.1 L-rhamnose mutarotase [Hymenobacter sp. 15J16-1T3B]
MEELAFTMQLKPGAAAEYRRRHDEIWPELTAALRAAGIRDYSIFLDEASGRLFAVQKRLPALPVMQRWWAHMAELMDTHPDHAPVVQPLTRVFHAD